MNTGDTTQFPQATARLLVNQESLINSVSSNEHTFDLVFGQPEVVRIKPSGDVLIAEGAALDDAARAFWKGLAEWRGTGQSATLADVQPGGRVRLGDALPPLPASSAQCLTTGAPLFSVEKMKLYALAALSAQPSPGGQDALVTALEVFERRRADIPYEVYEQVKAVCAAMSGQSHALLALVTRFRAEAEKHELWFERSLSSSLIDEASWKAYAEAADLLEKAITELPETGVTGPSTAAYWVAIADEVIGIECCGERTLHGCCGVGSPSYRTADEVLRMMREAVK